MTPHKPEYFPHDDTPIWRYRDLSQFLSILEKQALWFSRPDQFPDTFEGSYPKATVESRKQRIPVEELADSKEQREKIVQSIDEDRSKRAKLARKTCYLNCWHINTHESLAMWELYLSSDKGVAIKSTVGDFRKAINNKNNNAKIVDDLEDDESVNRALTIGKVGYADYTHSVIDDSHSYQALFHKRLSYQHEKELRAVYSRTGDIWESIGLNPEAEMPLPVGEYVKIDVEDLIQAVHIAPTSPDWFYELVKSIVNKYDIEIDIIRSDINGDPVF